jgi:ATP-binding cassette, subfamily B, multidrug efflux pump
VPAAHPLPAARMKRLPFLLSLLRQHALSYLGGTVLLAATVWMTLSIPVYLKEAIDILGANPDPTGSAFLNRIEWILAFALAIIFTRTGSRLCFFVPGRRVEFDLKNRLLAHLTTLQRGFFLDNPSGAIISRINNDINGVRMMMGFGLMGLGNAVGMLSLAPYYMYSISPRLTLYCALPIAAAFLTMQFAIRRLRREQLVQMQSLQDLSDFTVESYNGIDVLKSYRALGWSEGKFERLSAAVRDAGIRMSNVRVFVMPILTHIVNALKVMLVLLGGIMVVQQEMTMGGFLGYGLYLSMLVPPLMGMTFMIFVLQRGFTSLISLGQVFSTQPELPPVSPAAEASLAAQLRAGLRVQGLAFAYADDPAHPVLRDVSFAVRPGEIVGLFGPIGAGKTTLVNLLNRYLPPPPGTIRLDGIDVTELSQARLRSHVVTVTQEPFLFSDSVRENVRFAAVVDDPAALEQAVQAAALAPDLASFPAGLETLVGEKGITLSGGQKQRIALARATLKPCDLLILDDVLSAVDHETERHLIEQIYRFRQARATLIVSHRISALERAHRVIVLEDGRVTASGPHAELIEREGPYRRAWLLQREGAPPGAEAPPAQAPEGHA